MVLYFFKKVLLPTLFLAGFAKAASTPDTVEYKIIAINDFHGQIIASPKASYKPVGAAAVLASYIEAAVNGWQNRCVFVESGDLVGASQPECALLQDEPAILFMNYINRKIPVIGALGNHELDKGIPELKRLLYGGNFAKGPFLQNPWKGANFPVLCANMTDSATSLPLQYPFTVKYIPGINVPIAFIAAILKETPAMVAATSAQGLKFNDEVTTINYYVSMLREVLGVHAFVVLLHQGGKQTPYSGWTDTFQAGPSSDIVSMVSQFDDDVDIVCTAHSHSFTNAIVKTKTAEKYW